MYKSKINVTFFIKIEEDQNPRPAPTSPPIRNSHRSVRYSICESCLLLGQFIGSISSGYLIGNKRNLDNFRNVYLISLGIFIAVLIYTIAMFAYLKWQARKIQRLKLDDSGLNTSISLNTSEYLQNDEILPKEARNQEIPEVSITSVTELSFFKKQFRFIFDIWTLMTRPRPNNARFLILALLFMFFIGSSISMGIMSLQFQYVVKRPIHMTQINYGYFKAANTACRAVALLIVLPVLKRFFNTPDYILFIIGFTSEFLNLVAFSLAYYFKFVIWFSKLPDSVFLVEFLILKYQIC